MTLCLQGADRYYNIIKDMIGYYPSPYMKYCWKFITPCFCVVSTLSVYYGVCKL